MILHFGHEWTAYGLSMRVYIGVGLVMVFADVWVDSWTKAPPEQQDEPKCIASSVYLEDPWIGQTGLTKQIETAINTI